MSSTRARERLTPGRPIMPTCHRMPPRCSAAPPFCAPGLLPHAALRLGRRNCPECKLRPDLMRLEVEAAFDLCQALYACAICACK